jgi:hypothetical protein
MLDHQRRQWVPYTLYWDATRLGFDDGMAESVRDLDDKASPPLLLYNPPRAGMRVLFSRPGCCKGFRRHSRLDNPVPIDRGSMHVVHSEASV